MNSKNELLKKVHDYIAKYFDSSELEQSLLDEIQAELAKPNQDPLGWWVMDDKPWWMENRRSQMSGPTDEWEKMYKDKIVACYTAPQQNTKSNPVAWCALRPNSDEVAYWAHSKETVQEYLLDHPDHRLSGVYTDPQPSNDTEPTAWLYDFTIEGETITDWTTTDLDSISNPENGYHNIRPLYLSPQQHKTLTDAEIIEERNKFWDISKNYIEFARAIEKAITKQEQS